jgi:hypothetical protein
VAATATTVAAAIAAASVPSRSKSLRVDRRRKILTIVLSFAACLLAAG